MILMFVSIHFHFLTLLTILIFVHRRKDTQDSLPMTQRSLVHFFSTMNSDITLPLSWSLSYEMLLDYNPSSPQFSGITISTIGQKTPKTTGVGLSRSENSLGVNSSIMTKRQALLLAPEIPVTGEGEDYFLSLFGDSKKLLPHSFHAEKAWKHFSMILEEVGQSRSSALGDIKIAEVNFKGLFVKLINSSLDKELEIGGHILQQNMNGQTVSLYRFPPNIIMQANCTITVWAAASEAKHQPPSDFLWREQNKFRTSPNCTTILCKPNGENWKLRPGCLTTSSLCSTNLHTVGCCLVHSYSLEASVGEIRD
nr:lamin tail domain-containing protein 1 isoform X2 [Mirounga angustirostris]XP_054363116.1 lamin tail domain-containing protein 1 isoform X2 [Mirounga angustirostris]